MSVQYINPLLESTVAVLRTMAFVDITSGKPTVKDTNRTVGDVTGTIELKGPNVDGWLAVSFVQSTILDIVNNMLGENPDGIDDTVVDLVGEITNMITGNAKRLYSEQGMDIGLSRPTVIIGNDRELPGSEPGRSIVLPFFTSVGQMSVEFCFH